MDAAEQAAMQDGARTPRQRWMAVLARATAAELSALLAQAPALPAHARLRGPETGMVMLRGRMCGSGAAFNLGEMTVTRCTVQAGGAVGHATVAGRDPARAELAARLDAALQDAAAHDALHAAVVAPLARAQAARREAQSRKAGATRIDFSALATMRG